MVSHAVRPTWVKVTFSPATAGFGDMVNEASGLMSALQHSPVAWTQIVLVFDPDVVVSVTSYSPPLG